MPVDKISANSPTVNFTKMLIILFLKSSLRVFDYLIIYIFVYHQMACENPRLKFYDIIKTFKDQIVALLGDTSLVISDDDRIRHIKKFNSLYDKIIVAKKANSRLAIEMFYNKIFVPFGEKIITQNEEFFLQNRQKLTCDDDFKDMGLGDLIESISNIWPQLDNNNKKIIWRYILGICKVTDMVMGEGLFDKLKQSVEDRVTNASVNQ